MKPEHSPEPRNTVERAVQAGIDVIGECLGDEPGVILVVVKATGLVPEGEPDTADVLSGTELDGLELHEQAKLLLSYLLSAASVNAEAIGLRISVLPLGHG